MIYVVNSMLVKWGNWASRGRDGGVGYPSISPMFNNMPKGDSYSSHIFWTDQDILDTDKAVNRLEPEDRVICIEMYQIGGKTKDIYERRNIPRQRFYERLHRIHNDIMGHLNDISAGI